MEVIFMDSQTKLEQLDAYAMAIGFFDGVHIGHQKLLKTASNYAKRHQIKSAALTFSPHPDEVIKGMEDRKYITLLHEKIEKIASCGIDTIFVMKFDMLFASLDPYRFIEKYILDMKVKHVVVGFDFTFGFKAQGNTGVLQKVAKETDAFSVSVIPKETVYQMKIGSTETKELVKQGKVNMVPSFLGENYRVTANAKQVSAYAYQIEVNDKYILPEEGVYAIKISTKYMTFYGNLYIKDVGMYVELKQLSGNIWMDQCTVTFYDKVTVNDAILV